MPISYLQIIDTTHASSVTDGFWSNPAAYDLSAHMFFIKMMASSEQLLAEEGNPEDRVPLKAAMALQAYMRPQELIERINPQGTWEFLGTPPERLALIWPMGAREVFHHADDYLRARVRDSEQAIVEIQHFDHGTLTKPPEIERMFVESLALMCYAEALMQPVKENQRYAIATRIEWIEPGRDQRAGIYPHIDTILTDTDGKNLMVIERAYNCITDFPTLGYVENGKGVPIAEIKDKMLAIQAFNPPEKVSGLVKAYLDDIDAVFEIMPQNYITGFLGRGSKSGWLHSAQPLLRNSIYYDDQGPNILVYPIIRKMTTLFVGQKLG